MSGVSTPATQSESQNGIGTGPRNKINTAFFTFLLNPCGGFIPPPTKEVLNATFDVM